MNTGALQDTRSHWGWKQWTLYVCGCSGVLLLFPFLLFLSPIWDIDPIDDSLIRITPVPLPEERNGRPEFEKAREVLELPERDILHAYLDDPGKYREEIEGWVLHNREYREWLARAMAKGDYQEAWTENVEEYYVAGGMNLYKILSLTSLEAALEKDSSKRADLYLDQIRTGIWIANGSFLAITGDVVLYYGLEELRKEFQQHRPDRALLQKTLDRIDSLPSYELETLKYTGYLMYLAARYYLKDTDHIELPDNWFGRRQFFFQPNRTEKNLLEFQLYELNKLFPEDYPGTFTGEAAFNETLDRQEEKLFGLPKFFNHRGKEYIEYGYADSSFYVLHKKALNRLNLFRLQLALQLYQLDHGANPDSLEALVPEYLETLPADSFSNQPFRYLPEQGRLYSVGENEKDDQGEEDHDDVIRISEWADSE